jgi:hypothetical protein
MVETSASAPRQPEGVTAGQSNERQTPLSEPDL